jgi:hypothetical protein
MAGWWATAPAVPGECTRCRIRTLVATVDGVTWTLDARRATFSGEVQARISGLMAFELLKNGYFRERDQFTIPGHANSEYRIAIQHDCRIAPPGEWFTGTLFEPARIKMQFIGDGPPF